MTPSNPLNSDKPKFLAARRLPLLASVAGLAVVVIVGGPKMYHAIDLAPVSAAHAAVAEHAPVGFADLVAKVKPAVMSVRVRIERPANTNGMSWNEGDNGNPFPPGSPMEKFFQQFGFPGMPNGTLQQQADDHRSRLRLLHLAGRLRRDQQPRRRSRQDRADHHRRRRDL